MKRAIAIIITLALAVSLLSACGFGKLGKLAKTIDDAKKSGKSDDDVAKDFLKDIIDMSGESEEEREKAKDIIDSYSNEWPTDRLPKGFPKYPEGKFVTLTANDTTTMTIGETSEKTMKKYVETLKDKGWTFDDDEQTESMGIYKATKDGCELLLAKQDKDSITLVVKNP